DTEAVMVRPAYVFVAFLIPCTATAQTVVLQRGDIVTGVAPPIGAPPRDTRPLTGSAVIRGRVVDASSGAPLRKASVRIFGPEIRESRSATTDLEGRYEFTDLPAGQFNLNVTKSGYVDLAYGQST